MLIFENFISPYEKINSRDSSSTRKSKLNAAWMTHLMRECSRHHSVHSRQLWLGGAPGKCKTVEAAAVSNYKARGSLPCTRVLSRPDRQTAVIPGSSHAVQNNEQPAHADRLGRVNSLVDVSVTGVKSVSANLDW